jgi:AraC-like DNA-binding protein
MPNKPAKAISEDAYFRYLPVSPEAQEWGVYVTTAGHVMVPPHSPYPRHQHPGDHHFSWENGRILPHFQLIYIERGQGEFESGTAGLQEVRAGDLLVIFPEIWHRYRPDPETGWEEYWLEMDGDYLRRLTKLAGLKPERPVLRLDHQPGLLQAYQTALDLLRREPPGYQFQLGVQALQMLALVVSAQRSGSVMGRPVEELIREAREVLSTPGTSLSPDQLARRLNLSPSSFRRLFKSHTGFSPAQYAQQIALKRASNLLRNTTWPVGRIADELGFSSVFYFSRLFKQKAGSSPLEYRRQGNRGE